MKLFFLGTSSGVPTLDRNVSSTLVIHDVVESEFECPPNIWMFDCGEGTQHQILKAQKLGKKGISFSRLSKIFITHLHGDHCFGVPGLLAMCSMKKCTQPITLYGPKGLKRYVETALEISSCFLSFKLDIIELTSNDVNKLGKIDRFEVFAYPITHRVECFGYVLNETCEESGLGDFQASKAISLGVPKQKINELIRNGKIDIGEKIVQLNECLGPSLKGRKVVILGDTCNSDSIIEDAKNCDVLVHECTFDSTMTERALKSMHSTSRMVGEFSQKVMPNTLVITHYSMRYVEVSKGEEKTVNDLLNETKSFCSEKTVVFAADDFWSFEIPPKYKLPKKQSEKGKQEVISNSNKKEEEEEDQ